MSDTYKQFKIFVSSPGDVTKERALVDQIISNINDVVKDSLKIFLQVEKWEIMPPETTEENIQERLNRKIKDCNFFLLILYKRYGTVEKGHTISNTEREINAIINYLSKDKKKKIISYFRKLKKNVDPGEQEKGIIALRKRLVEGNWFYKEYLDERDFEIKLTHDLYNILLKMSVSSFKKEQLKKFWQVGKVDGQSAPEVSVVYPPVPREWMAVEEKFNLWQQRLLPNLFFEDYKALHKILKNLSMVGLSNYRVYSKYDLPTNFDQTNVVWICLPRLFKGLSTLDTHKDRRFDITPRGILAKQESKIKWKTSSGEWISIKSPLRNYLFKQRPEVDPDSDWDKTLGNIIAKDYAIVARFNRVLSVNENPGMEKLKEFYLTGIHGLGTWGAAWFVDRNYGIFRDMDDDLENIQLLIEVEYRDGKIHRVIDVSNCEKEYFDNELKLKTIKNNIDRYKERTL